MIYLHNIRSMLQFDDKLQQDIQRSIDRLKIVSQEVSAVNSIPAFYYSASLLNNYAKMNGPEACRSELFQEFKQLILEFGKQDFSQIKKHHQAIIDDILEIVDSQLFINCLRPDIRSSKSSRYLKPFQDNGHQQHLSPEYKLKSNQARQAFKKNNQSPNKSIQSSASYYINQFDELWQMVERNYREHNIDDAFKKASEYVEKVGKKVQIPQNRLELINAITMQYTQMMNYYEQFDKPGWIFDKQQKGITLEYKVFEEQKQVAIRINGQFPIPPVEFLSIIGEIDLMGEYVPFCYDCKQLKAVSRNQRVGTSKIYIPLLSDRQTYFYAVGYDRINETGALFLYSKTINENKAMQQKCKFEVPPPNDKFVRLQYKFFIVEYKPVGNGRARIRLASKIDMKMNYLPLFILNKSARIFAFDYFKNILQKVKNYKGSQWQKKVASRPDMYEFFFQKIRQKFGAF